MVSIVDATARANALEGGQLEYAHGLSFAAARKFKANPDLQVILGGPGNSAAHGVSMNT